MEVEEKGVSLSLRASRQEIEDLNYLWAVTNSMGNMNCCLGNDFPKVNYYLAVILCRILEVHFIRAARLLERILEDAFVILDRV